MTNQMRKRYVDPLVYKVGEHISHEKYQEALTKIADWFVEFRNTKEPALLAKQMLQECLDGVKNDGTPWFSAANSTLAARVRIKCRFDLDTMEPLRTATEKRKARKEREKLQKGIKKAKESEDAMIPDEIRKEIRKDISYGDDPVVWMTSAEQRAWTQLFKDYQKQHPELNAVSALEELKMICDTHILMERFRMQQLSNKTVDQVALEATVKRFTALKKSLGIHPDQIKNKTRGTMDGSISEAVATFTSRGEEYLNLRKRLWIEELLQMFQMYCTKTADGKGYQLDDVGLYGLTRTRPEPCPKCGTLVYGGLDIEDVKRYLIQQGALEEVEETNEDSSSDSSGNNDGTAGATGGTEAGDGAVATVDSGMAEQAGHSPHTPERLLPPAAPENHTLRAKLRGTE